MALLCLRQSIPCPKFAWDAKRLKIIRRTGQGLASWCISMAEAETEISVTYFYDRNAMPRGSQIAPLLIKLGISSLKMVQVRRSNVDYLETQRKAIQAPSNLLSSGPVLSSRLARGTRADLARSLRDRRFFNIRLSTTYQLQSWCFQHDLSAI